MLHINSKSVEGQKFFANDPAIEYVCVGYGQDPTSAANYIVGVTWDQANNRSRLKTMLLKDVTFVGNLTLLPL